MKKLLASLLTQPFTLGIPAGEEICLDELRDIH
jgi:hypothetical protein